MLIRLRPYPTVPDRLAVEPAAVHIWDADPDRPPLPPAELLASLTAAERERHARLAHPQVAARFAHGRGLLRVLLAGYLGCRPDAVPLVVTPDGKPEVPGGPRFNLSHTAGRMLTAVAAVPVGVDVEPVRVVASADELVRRWFHPAERVQYERLPDGTKPAAFLRGWTCKEALLKGVGCGARELAGCRVDLDPARPPAVHLSPDGQIWELVCWNPTSSHVAALAVRADGPVEVSRVGGPGIEPGT